MSTSSSTSQWRNFPAALGASSILGGFVGAVVMVAFVLLLRPNGIPKSISADLLYAQVRFFVFIFFYASSISFIATLVLGPPVWWLFGRGKFATPSFFGAVGCIAGGLLFGLATGNSGSALFGALPGLAGGAVFAHCMRPERPGLPKTSLWVNRSFTVAAAVIGLYLLSVLLPFATSYAVSTASHAIDRVAGKQIVTLKTRMHWHEGAAIRGERVKTWQLAVPSSLQLKGTDLDREGWNRFTLQVPVYGTDGTERHARRHVGMNAYWGPDGNLGSSGSREQMFALTLTNELPGLVDAKVLQAAAAQSVAPARCISHGNWVAYHGWVVRLWNPSPHLERNCTVVAAAFDRWTVRIDDLHSKDSGEP